MASRRLQRQYAFVLSVLGHAAIVVALTFSLPLSSRQSPLAGGVVVPIDTVLVNEAAVEAEIARLEAEEEAARVREREAQLQREREEAARQEQIRQQEEELARLQAETEQREQEARQEALRLEAAAEERRLAEQRRREEQERERQEELARQRAEEERQREEAAQLAAEKAERERREAEEAARLAAVEAEIERAMEAERLAREAENSGLRAQWSAAIAARVERYWNKPPNAGAGLECVLVVTQLPNGEVTAVNVESCNRNDQNIIRSIENAVLNASPLPGPPRGVPFERVIRMTFRPAE